MQSQQEKSQIIGYDIVNDLKREFQNGPVSVIVLLEYYHNQGVIPSSHASRLEQIFIPANKKIELTVSSLKANEGIFPVTTILIFG